jgi:hypothetical protein
MGFKYQYDMRKIIDESLECGKRLAALQLIDKMDSNTS